MSFSDGNFSVVRPLCCCHCNCKHCSNEGPYPFPRGDDYKIEKIYWWNFQNNSPEPPNQFNLNWVQSILGWVKGVQFCSDEGPRPYPRGYNYEIEKIQWQKFFKNSLLNHWANFNLTWHKASLGEGDESFFKWRVTPFSTAQSIFGWRGLKVLQIRFIQFSKGK